MLVLATQAQMQHLHEQVMDAIRRVTWSALSVFGSPKDAQRVDDYDLTEEWTTIRVDGTLQARGRRTGPDSFEWKVEANAYLGWQWHPQDEEVCVLSGDLMLKECRPDCQRLTVYEAGDTVIIPAGVPHAATSRKPSHMTSRWLRTPGSE